MAFHHAGLQIQDRSAVEYGYLEGDINVICCTSTLAVGVNLPCHMVIIKNTVTYQSSALGGCKEYSDVEIMQMLGRAGRPQFDSSAVAVIMTRLQRVQHYEKMITGQEILESCLHRNLIDHLNAEIGLGTVTSVSSAKKWLSGTFLYVRLKENPEHYKLDGDAPGRNLDERLENICRKGIALLEENDLVRNSPGLQSTEFGDAMARYYLQFDTMRVFLSLPPNAKVSEILSAISQAAEFKDIRFRAGEKSTYKDLNKNGSIKFPIPVNLDAPAHKVSLVIQSTLGAIELPTEDHKPRVEYSSAKATIFQHAHRLIRCIVDCQLYLDDAVTTRNALMLARSLGAQVWDDSPLHMKQLEGVGLVSVRKLAVAGVKSIEDIEGAEQHRLEHILSRNPPYGAQLQEKARAFPKLMVCLKSMGEPVIKRGEHVIVKIKAEIGFLNEKVPELFQRRAVYVCLLAETSDGHKIHFARISAKKLNKGQDVLFSANLTNASQTVRAYVMCDEVAGTARSAILKPDIPAFAFPPPKTAEQMNQKRFAHAPNTSKRRASASKPKQEDVDDEFGDAGLYDADLVMAENGGFVDIDDLDGAANDAGKPKQKKQKVTHTVSPNGDWEPRQLANGKWACNHACKDKTACKHLCCREGLDKQPKPPKAKETKKQVAEPGSDPKQTQLTLSLSKGPGLPTPAKSSVDKASSARRAEDAREVRDLNRLHNSVKSNTPNVPTIGKYATAKDPVSKQSKSGAPSLSFLGATRSIEDQGPSSDYGNDVWESNDFQPVDDFIGTEAADRMSPPKYVSEYGSLDDGMLDAVYAAGSELQQNQPLDEGHGDGYVDLSSYANDDDMQPDVEWQMNEPIMSGALGHLPTTPWKSNSSNELLRVGKGKGLFISSDSTRHRMPDSTVAGGKRGYDDSAFDEIAGEYTYSAPDKKQKRLSRTPSAQLREEMEQAMQPMMEHAFAGEDFDENAEQEPSHSLDELKKWFTTEFGTEHFNFVG